MSEKAIVTKTETAVAAPKSVRELFTRDDFRDKISIALPSHMKADRMMRVAATAAQKNPALMNATPPSFMLAMLDLSSMGLEPDGRRAALVCYKNEVKAMVMYQGLVEMMMRTGLVSYIHADTVCDKDVFEYSMGTVTKHVINFREPRGPVYAVYAIIHFKDGTEKTEVMSTADIEAVRKRSRAANDGPWVTDWAEMAKKTVFRRAAKWVSLSAEFRDAIDLMDKNDPIDIQSTVVTEEVKRPIFSLPQAVEEKEKPKKAEPKGALQLLVAAMDKEGITESALLEYMRTTGACDESLSSLEEVHRVSPGAIDMTLKVWDDVAKAIKPTKE
jgi:recombination protein RecT